MICAVKTDQLKKCFHGCAPDPDASRALEKAHVSPNQARRTLQVESGLGADWLPEDVSRLRLGQSAAPCLPQRANTRRPRAPIEDEPEREAS